MNPTNIRRGERLARPLAKPGRLRRETLRADTDDGIERIPPGTCFKRSRTQGVTYLMYLGCANDDPECLYFLELGATHLPSIGLPERYRRSAWLTDYEAGMSLDERVSLTDAMTSVYETQQ